MRLHGGLVRVAVAVAATLVLASCQGLGGPNNVFGNDLPDGCLSLTSTVAPCPNPNVQPGVWAAIQGPFTRHQDGDPFATMCATDTQTSTVCDPNWPTGGAPFSPATSVQNPTYRPNGYSWAVDVPTAAVGTEVSVEIYDPANGGTGPPVDETLQSIGGTFTTSYELFHTTGSLLVKETPDLSMAGHCSWARPAGLRQRHQHRRAVLHRALVHAVHVRPTVAGIYPLQVKTSDIPGVEDAGAGWNAYAVKAVSSTSTQPSVYGLDNLSMWFDSPATSPWMYLTNVGPAVRRPHHVRRPLRPGRRCRTRRLHPAAPGSPLGPDADPVGRHGRALQLQRHAVADQGPGYPGRLVELHHHHQAELGRPPVCTTAPGSASQS